MYATKGIEFMWGLALRELINFIVMIDYNSPIVNLNKEGWVSINEVDTGMILHSLAP